MTLEEAKAYVDSLPGVVGILRETETRLSDGSHWRVLRVWLRCLASNGQLAQIGREWSDVEIEQGYTPESLLEARVAGMYADLCVRVVQGSP